MQWHRRENLLRYTGKSTGRRRGRDTGARKSQPPVETRELTEEEWAARKRRT